MCFGEGLDTMVRHECTSLRAWAAEEFSSHDFLVRANAEGLTWVVLEPPTPRADLLRFTICRVAPCIMVMVENGADERQFCSANDVAGAMAFVRNAADEAMLAAMNAHPAHRPLQ